MKTLTEEQRESLHQVILAKLHLWDAATEAELSLGCDIDLDAAEFSEFCSGLPFPADAIDVQDEDLIRMFGLAAIAKAAG